MPDAIKAASLTEMLRAAARRRAAAALARARFERVLYSRSYGWRGHHVGDENESDDRAKKTAPEAGEVL